MRYRKPFIGTEKFFETSALACGKTPNPPAGAHHWSFAYETFTGHLGPGFGTDSSVFGQAGLGFGSAGTSLSYSLEGLCSNWVLLAS